MMLYGRFVHVLPFLAVALLEACGGGGTTATAPQLHTPGIAVGEPHPQPAPLVRDFELLSTGNSGIGTARTVVVRDQDAFSKLWAEHASNTIPARPEPAVDFKTKMVVGVFAGMINNGCGGGVSLHHVRDEGIKLAVSYDVTVASPQPGIACPAVMGTPAVLAVVDRSDAPVQFVTASSAPVALTSLDKSTHSNVKTARVAVVKDEAAWVALWTEHNGAVKAPAVDFSRNMVVASFMGERPTGCYAVTMGSALRAGSVVTVRRTHNVPGPAVLCTQAVSSPAHIVVMEKTDDKVVFATETVPL